MEKEITRIKEYTLEKTHSFMENFYNAFKDPLPPEEALERFKGFFKTEADFYRHVKKHAVYDLFYLLGLKPEELSWEAVKGLISQSKSAKEKVYQYFLETLTALAYPTTTFYEERYEGASKDIIIYSGFRKRLIITVEGNKLKTSYRLKGFRDIKEWKTFEEERAYILIEVGIDERIRRGSVKIRDILKRYI